MSAGLLRVLTYHRVMEAQSGVPASSVVSATPAVFARQMRHLAERYRVVSAVELLDAVRRRRPLPGRAVLITFDDAYRDVGDTAWPILRRHRLPAIVFVPTAFPDRPDRQFWWDRLHHAFNATTRRTLKWEPLGLLALDTPAARRMAIGRVNAYLKSTSHAQAMEGVEWLCAQLGEAEEEGGSVLSWSELRELARDGMSLGAHTRTHPALSRLPLSQMRAEILGSREDLRREIGDVPPIFAYPFGDHDAAVVAAVRDAGFEVALTCLDGQNSIGSADPLRLRRTNISRRTSPFLFRLRLLTPVSYLDSWRHHPAGRGRSDAAIRP